MELEGEAEELCGRACFEKGWEEGRASMDSTGMKLFVEQKRFFDWSTGNYLDDLFAQSRGNAAGGWVHRIIGLTVVGEVMGWESGKWLELTHNNACALKNSRSVVVWLVRILGSRPTDPGASPGNGNSFYLIYNNGNFPFRFFCYNMQTSYLLKDILTQFNSMLRCRLVG